MAIFSVKQNDFSNFGKGLLEEHFCEIILKSGHLPKRRYCFKVFLLFRSGCHFVEWQGKILAILVKGHKRNISVPRRKCQLKVFLYLALADILFSRVKRF